MFFTTRVTYFVVYYARYLLVFYYARYDLFTTRVTYFALLVLGGTFKKESYLANPYVLGNLKIKNKKTGVLYSIGAVVYATKVPNFLPDLVLPLLHALSLSLPLIIYVLCVCERERERECVCVCVFSPILLSLSPTP